MKKLKPIEFTSPYLIYNAHVRFTMLNLKSTFILHHSDNGKVIPKITFNFSQN